MNKKTNAVLSQADQKIRARLLLRLEKMVAMGEAEFARRLSEIPNVKPNPDDPGFTLG